ncbi:hypothetical protein HS7_01860 [Sulfolobales archaeon HS-7]|nr:hypothetical protein HS7_01860 [Sulfolobales archaeon HS-7]
MPTLLSPLLVLNDVRRDIDRKYQRVVEYVDVSVIPFDPRILGFIREGSNTIFVNAIPLERAMDKYEHLYVVLTHELIHMSGVADEREVRKMTMDLIEEKFSPNSYAYTLAQSLLDPVSKFLRDSWKKGRPNTFI